MYVDTVGSFTWARFCAMHDALPKQQGFAGRAESQGFLELYRVFTSNDLLQLLFALNQALEQVSRQQPCSQ